MAELGTTAAARTKGFTLTPYSYAEARALTEGLGLAEPVAVTLVRRGYRTVEAARAFLEAGDDHDPLEFEQMASVVARLRSAIEARRRITVHGDYDVDGVCATAILVGALRALGADCDWYIPDRADDGYGLTTATVEELAARGTELLITVDCGITCADQVRRARGLDLETIVTDHHRPGEELPDCLILHPELSGYPCPELCATGVAYKLAAALRGAEAVADELDLVALATVADMVPLRGENRALVRRGLAVARRARRPGLRALIASAGISPERLDEGDLAFRLGPRINAAGRLYRADAGVELMLTDDLERAGEIAVELERANRERRAVEREVLEGAERALRELPSEHADARGLVVAGEGWHPGVVGIVASRLVERHSRPVVLVSIDGDRARGSGRSIPGFDLLEALRACDEHLARYGGHRAAAGVELEAGRLDAFREAFARHAAAALSDEDLIRSRARRRSRRRREPRPRGRRAARAPCPLRRPETPACDCWCRRRPSPTCARWGRASATPASRCAAAPAGRSASPSVSTASSTMPPATRSTSRCAWSSTSGTGRSSPGSCSATCTGSVTPMRPSPRSSTCPSPPPASSGHGWTRSSLASSASGPHRDLAPAAAESRREVIDRRGSSGRGDGGRPGLERGGRARRLRRRACAAGPWSSEQPARRGSAAARWPSPRRAWASRLAR